MHMLPEECGQSTVLLPTSSGETVLTCTGDELDSGSGFRGVSLFQKHPLKVEQQQEGKIGSETDPCSGGESFLQGWESAFRDSGGLTQADNTLLRTSSF